MVAIWCMIGWMGVAHAQATPAPERPEDAPDAEGVQEGWRAIGDGGSPRRYRLTVDAAPIDAAITHRAARRKRDQLAGSVSLLAWSVGNLGVGAAGWAIADDRRWQAFHRGNLLWNTVNVAIAIPSVIGAVREDPASWSLGKLMTEDKRLLTAYAVNTGLDVGYVFAGAFLHEYGRRTANDDLLGTGWALMAQGGYLFVYDLVMWALHGKQAQKLQVVPEVGQVMGLRVGGAF